MTQRIVKILDIENFCFGWELEYQNNDLKATETKEPDLFNSESYYAKIDELSEPIINGMYSDLPDWIIRKLKVSYCDVYQFHINTRDDFAAKVNALAITNGVSQAGKKRIDFVLNDAFMIPAIFEEAIHINDLMPWLLSDLSVFDAAKICFNYDIMYNLKYILRRYIKNNDLVTLAEFTTIGATIPPSLTLPIGVERVHDGSVSGGELRTAYGNKGTDLFNAKSLLRRLEANHSIINSLKHDYRCSFHVHVSNNNLSHSYGDNIQAFMYQYLFEHLKDIPLSVLHRLSGERVCTNWRNDYFQIRLSDRKYTAIAFRSEHESWEFRFMGNISCASDGVKCLDFAQECYCWAYKQAKIKGLHCEHLNNFEQLARNIVSKADTLIREATRQVA